ncbi:MAG: hypothetical protein HZB38_14595, partial [Planctomycetes bacterium]|nr:hypothetical protein [Planctomycetota bacterium]
MYKLFLTIRYLRKRRIAYFAVAAVTLCVAMVLVVMSVMGGWLDQVKNRARGLLGDVVIDNGAQAGFPLYQEFIDQIAAWPEIEKATPVVYTVGLVGFTNTARSAYVEVVGIRLGEVCQVNAFKGGLFYEKWYPGTTKLDEAGWPKMGIDLKDPSWAAAGGSYINLVPPPPFDKLWKQAAAQYRAASGGKPLVDADSVDDPYNDVLRENGRDVIPGRWEVNEDAEGEQELGHPTVLAPGWTDEDRKLPGVILGRDIVARRETDGRYRRLYPKGLPVRLTVVPVTIRGKVDPKPVSKGFRYVDDSLTGIYEIDSRHVYVD